MTCRTLHMQASENMKSSLLDVENGLMDTVGEGKGGMNWEVSIDIYIYIYIIYIYIYIYNTMCKIDT